MNTSIPPAHIRRYSYMDKDLAAKECLNDDKRYADLVNGLLFGGEQRIQPSDLQEIDSQQWSKPGKKKKCKCRQVYRDLIKKTAFGVNFSLIGIENQELVHYLMPIRAMEYDLIAYRKQAAKIAKQLEEVNGMSSAEFISKFRKTDRLCPCITIVLFYGEDWDGAKTLHELLNFTDIPDDLRKYINDYPVHIFDILKIENTEVFRTDLRQIFNFLQCAKNKEKLQKLVEEDCAYQQLEEDAYDMISAFTNEEMFISVKEDYKKEGKVNMCQAFRELLEDNRLVGVKQGIEQSIFRLVCKKVEKNYTLDMIADDLEEEVEVIRPIYEKAKKQIKDVSC